ncbi:MAG TPA: DinB family protein [Candidatus Xenobia bacterium]|nr:DinB family protein [Candidatus Xenobia bacterium]
MTKLDAIVDRLSQTRAKLLAVVEPVPPDRWRQQPPQGGWSAAEVIAHLTMVEQAILGGAERVLQKEPAPLPLWKRFHIPPKVSEWRTFKRETPIPLDPSLLDEKQVMLDRFAASRARILAFIDANRGRDLSRWRYPHPFFGSLNLYSWLKNIYHHEIRHTKQLREIARSV